MLRTGPRLSSGNHQIGHETDLRRHRHAVRSGLEGGARIYTLPVPVPKAAAAKPFNLKDIQGPIATALGVPQSSIRFEDLAVQPGSEIAYVSLTVRRGKSPAQAAIVSIDASGKVKTVDLRKVAGSAAITDEPSADQSFWRDLRRRA
ncbi:hypothetical protein ACFS07_33755 [Undibacterium arcticum]